MAFATAVTLVFIHISRLLANGNVEVSDVTAYVFDLRIGHQLNIWITLNVDHFGCKDTLRAVECRERLVKTGHIAADGRLLLH